MNKIEIANECLENLTIIIQEQNNEIEEMKLGICRSKHILKLLLSFSLNETQKLHICEVFDKASTEDEAILTYKKLLDELKFGEWFSRHYR